MAIISMTLEEAINSITPEMHARVLASAHLEPDLTDPDAPEVTDEMILAGYQAGTINRPLEVILSVIAPELETRAREIHAELTARTYYNRPKAPIDYVECAEENPVKYLVS
jgi:hypothetical protein